MGKDDDDDEGTKTTTKWNKAKDAELAELFRKGPTHGGISTRDLSKKYIHHVIKEFFPDRNYKTFAPLFRDKVRKYNLAQTLAGARKRGE
jgi:hypothetical protein